MKNKSHATRAMTPLTLWLNIAISMVFLIAAGVLFMALFSHDPADPAWRHNNGTTVNNPLGTLGAWYSDLSFSFIGKLSYLVPIALVGLIINIWREGKLDKELFSWRLFMLVTAILSGCVLWAKHDTTVINSIAQTGGGAIGAWLVIGLEKSIQSMPIIMAFSALIFAISISLLLNLPWGRLSDMIGLAILSVLGGLFSAGRKRPETTAPATEPSAANTALQEKIKHLNETAGQRPKKTIDEAARTASPRFTIDRYEPESDDHPTLASQSTPKEPLAQSTAQPTAQHSAKRAVTPSSAASNPATASDVFAGDWHDAASDARDTITLGRLNPQSPESTPSPKQAIPLDLSQDNAGTQKTHDTPQHKAEPSFFNFDEIKAPAGKGNSHSAPAPKQPQPQPTAHEAQQVTQPLRTLEPRQAPEPRQAAVSNQTSLAPQQRPEQNCVSESDFARPAAQPPRQQETLQSPKSPQPLAVTPSVPDIDSPASESLASDSLVSDNVDSDSLATGLSVNQFDDDIQSSLENPSPMATQPEQAQQEPSFDLGLTRGVTTGLAATSKTSMPPLPTTAPIDAASTAQGADDEITDEIPLTIPEAKPKRAPNSLETAQLAPERITPAATESLTIDDTAHDTIQAQPATANHPTHANVHANVIDQTLVDPLSTIEPATTTTATTATIGKIYDNTADNAVAEQQTVASTDTPYALPTVELLDIPPPQENAYTEDALAEMAGVLEKTLTQFNIKATVMHVSPGPVITRFELDLAPGIQAKKITNLSQDLARALAVSRVRVEEVIPGSSYVGLEVPNKQRQTVYFRDIVKSSAFQQSQSPLTISLGSDTSGKSQVVDLMKMPHALVAGTTGSGKSVCINVMLLSMLYKSTPDDLRLILVDPKMLEMSMYEDIPHLLTPVITDMNEAENALTWAVGEMERRYQLMAALKVRKIDAFNEQVDAANSRGEPIQDPLWAPDEMVGYTHPPTLERLPFIVIVIDELADMMMVVGKQVEQLIARLTQKARAAGIHVVLATQRPSTDVLTGLIKANVPTRIAFQVSSGTDSRVIIDGVGAEKLLGHGDMLYVPPGASHPQRFHGAFVGDGETDRITHYLRSLGEPQYIDGITGKQDPESLGAFGAAEAAESKEDADPLYEEGVQFVLESGKASISSVQRQLRIGYNRAARMIEDMQQQGIVSAPVNGVRKVLGRQ